jgi:exodeoxyribonuclease V alpha subunit
VLLIGDEKQLPPVGFGLLFHRFVHDASITASLTTIHRQADGSGIPTAAAVIRRRDMPDLPAYAGAGDGISMVVAVGREAIADATVQIHADMGGRAGDVLIITPINNGPCGVTGLNRRLHDGHVRATGLQELRGPLGDVIAAGEPLLHCRNNYKRGLFNGSRGAVRRIDRAERQVVATFDGEEHVFASDDLVDLVLGYALTCHRAQGSEADYVIVALPPSRLLDPSWLYTAVTRARKLVVIVGQSETIRDALMRSYADERRAVGLVWGCRPQA